MRINVTTDKGIEGTIEVLEMESSGRVPIVFYSPELGKAAQGFLDTSRPKENVRDLHTNEGVRRKGIATAIMLQMETEALLRGITKLGVTTNRDNIPARGLYNKLGFVNTGDTMHPEIGEAVSFELELTR